MPNDTKQPEDKMIRVWRWEDAPEEYRKLSTAGGDEDWVAVLPAVMKDQHIGWLEGDAFGACDVDTYELPDGRVVKIGAHS